MAVAVMTVMEVQIAALLDYNISFVHPAILSAPHSGSMYFSVFLYLKLFALSIRNFTNHIKKYQTCSIKAFSFETEECRRSISAQTRISLKLFAIN